MDNISRYEMSQTIRNKKLVVTIRTYDSKNNLINEYRYTIKDPTNKFLGVSSKTPKRRDIKIGDVYFNKNDNDFYVLIDKGGIPTWTKYKDTIRKGNIEEQLKNVKSINKKELIDLINIIKKLDGRGSGFDSDMLDGKDSSYFVSKDYLTIRLGELLDLIKNKANKDHQHNDLYYKKEECDNMLNMKSNVGHNHNDIYYTKDTCNKLLNTKADKDHNHNDLYYTKEYLDEALASKANATHNHNDIYYTKKECDDKLDTKSDKGHVHDDRYYIKSIIDKKLGTKSDKGHVHDDRYYIKETVDQLLNTKANKTHNHDLLYYKKEEVNRLLKTKASVTHNHDNRYYTKEECDDKLATKSDITHNHDRRYYTQNKVNELLLLKSDKTHNHDNRYYKKEDCDNMLSKKSDIGHLHDDRYVKLLDLVNELKQLKEEILNIVHDEYKDVVRQSELDKVIARIDSIERTIDDINNDILGLITYNITTNSRITLLENKLIDKGVLDVL